MSVVQCFKFNSAELRQLSKLGKYVDMLDDILNDHLVGGIRQLFFHLSVITF